MGIAALVVPVINRLFVLFARNGPPQAMAAAYADRCVGRLPSVG